MSRVAITTGVLFDLVMLWILCEFLSYLSTFANVTSLELVVLRGTGKITVLNGAESLCEIPWNHCTIHVAFTARVTPWPLMIGWRVSIDVFKCLVNPLTGVLLDMQFPVAYTSSLHFMAMGVIRLLKTKKYFTLKCYGLISCSHKSICPYFSGLLHWYWRNHIISPWQWIKPKDMGSVMNSLKCATYPQ